MPAITIFAETFPCFQWQTACSLPADGLLHRDREQQFRSSGHLSAVPNCSLLAIFRATFPGFGVNRRQQTQSPSLQFIDEQFSTNQLLTSSLYCRWRLSRFHKQIMQTSTRKRRWINLSASAKSCMRTICLRGTLAEKIHTLADLNANCNRTPPNADFSRTASGTELLHYVLRKRISPVRNKRKQASWFECFVVIPSWTTPWLVCKPVGSVVEGTTVSSFGQKSCRYCISHSMPANVTAENSKTHKTVSLTRPKSKLVNRQAPQLRTTGDQKWAFCPLFVTGRSHIPIFFNRVAHCSCLTMPKSRLNKLTAGRWKMPLSTGTKTRDLLQCLRWSSKARTTKLRVRVALLSVGFCLVLCPSFYVWSMRIVSS